MTRIKVVPEITPNADGEWIEAPVDLPEHSHWYATAVLLAPFIPDGYILVAIEGDRR